MMTAEERSLRNGGRFPDKARRVTHPVEPVPCSNLRIHGAHIWREQARPDRQYVCPGRDFNAVD